MWILSLCNESFVQANFCVDHILAFRLALERRGSELAMSSAPSGRGSFVHDIAAFTGSRTWTSSPIPVSAVRMSMMRPRHRIVPVDLALSEVCP